MNTVNSSSPINITATSHFSNSPSRRNIISNLTSALQEAGATSNQTSFLQPEPQSLYGDTRPPELHRNDSSISGVYGSYFATVTKPISMRDRSRRESNNGSFMAGVSWGASSINGGDWVRDDVIMAGTSPSAFPQSSSFQSSSYLPKMEASFFRDYWCCNMLHASLHDLMQHMEEIHGPQSLDLLSRPSMPVHSGLSFPKQMSPFSAIPKHQSQNNLSSPAHITKGFSSVGPPAKSTLATIQDDPLDNMEFDDQLGASILVPMSTDRAPMRRQPFAQAMASANTNITFPFLNSNPTVSSVNTPSLSAATQHKTSPDPSMAATPHNTNMQSYDATLLAMFKLPDQNPLAMSSDGFDFNNLNMKLPTDLGALTIDDPANQLSSKNGNMNGTNLQFALLNAGYPLVNEPNQTTHQQQQQISIDMPGSILAYPGQDEKKYRCPVIGCEKAYKNQNGLKYHKTVSVNWPSSLSVELIASKHGHINQKLKLNDDGSFSIVDPITSVPYPGTVGMEKEKPYRCEKCGKRYKNLNGLKYHRQHSPYCNPELHTSTLNAVPSLLTMQQLQNIPPGGTL